MIPQIVLLNASVPAERVFGLDMHTLISIGIQLFNAGLLAAILAFLLYNPVRNYMQKRTERIKKQMDQAEIDLVKAKELKAQYEKKLNEVELERNEILDSARKLAAEKTSQVLSSAKDEAEGMKTRAAQEIQMEQERVKDEMKMSIINISSHMAAKFVDQKMDKKMQDKLFDDAVAELEDLTWQN